MRVKRGFKARRRRNRALDLAKGFRGARSKLFGIAVEAVRRSLVYAYRDRKVRKREFRRLWIIRINAAVQQHGLKYSRFIAGLQQSGIELNRKVLSEMSIHHPEAFKTIVDRVKSVIAH